MTEAIDTKQQKKQHLKEVQHKLLCFGEIFLNDTTFPLSQNKNNKKKRISDGKVVVYPKIADGKVLVGLKKTLKNNGLDKSISLKISGETDPRYWWSVPVGLLSSTL